ncbi:MAG: FAD-dependent monooxygenase [Gammaproteobacteria bacterium]|nr:FAD-dependent monooxygenase [Gammaproteobacteria bacterium]
MSARYQAAVAGGGTVGLACALLLNRRCGWDVALVERSAPRKSEGKEPQRALTLSPGAVETLNECGLQPGRPPGGEGVPPSTRTKRPRSQDFPAHAFSRMVVWRGEGGPASGNSITFDAAELGVKSLGCVAHEAPLRRALWDLAQECKGIRVYSGAALTSVRIDDDCGYLDLDNGEEIGAELLIGADGAQSKLRSALGVEFRSTGYGQTGLVFEADCSEADGDTAWQRFEDDGVLALLPLSESRMSIVWSLPDERAERIKDLDDKGLQTALNETGAGVAGNLTPATPIASFPLRRGRAEQTCGERYALVGEAARTIHPLAGQGLNLGLGDAEALARVCAGQGDALIGDARVLGRFARERARYGEEMSWGIHAINAAFSGPMAPLASRGMAAVDRFPPLKRQLAARAMR